MSDRRQVSNIDPTIRDKDETRTSRENESCSFNSSLESIIKEVIKVSLDNTIRSKGCEKLLQSEPKKPGVTSVQPPPQVVPHYDTIDDSEDNTKDRVRRCLLCNGEASLRNQLISPCICTNWTRQVHVNCLLNALPLSSVGHCKICHFAFKFERKRKPFSKFTKNTNALKQMILGIFFMMVWILIAFLLYWIIFDLNAYIFHNISNFEWTSSVIMLLLGVIWHFCIASIMAKRIKKSWSSWYESNIMWELRAYEPTLI